MSRASARVFDLVDGGVHEDPSMHADLAQGEAVPGDWWSGATRAKGTLRQGRDELSVAFLAGRSRLEVGLLVYLELGRLVSTATKRDLVVGRHGQNEWY
ncbi:MAG: hypothetical protein ACYC1I_12190 [Acidimicrobiales bacterium]